VRNRFQIQLVPLRDGDARHPQRQAQQAHVLGLHALLQHRVSLDIDGNNIISEEELRASPESGAIKGIITERDYLRAVALGNVTWNTKVELYKLNPIELTHSLKAPGFNP
jgi:hypothetical protein